jgi:uncharacterized cupredoxin-like copper-binding protein
MQRTLLGFDIGAIGIAVFGFVVGVFGSEKGQLLLQRVVEPCRVRACGTRSTVAPEEFASKVKAMSHSKGWNMLRNHRLRYLPLIIAAGLVFAACSSDDSSDTTMAADMDMEGEFAFGDPMEASSADRVIEITAKDDFTFFPSGATVTKGETVTFRVTNDGKIPHDFVLGDAHMQDEHEEEMAEMAGDDMAMHDEPNAFVLEPGETKDMTWHMTEGGEILFGCHQTGHYAAGMKGTVVIQG